MELKLHPKSQSSMVDKNSETSHENQASDPVILQRTNTEKQAEE